MNIYEVVVGETVTLAQDVWLVRASNATEAFERAESKRKRRAYTRDGWEVTSVRKLNGELIN